MTQVRRTNDLPTLADHLAASAEQAIQAREKANGYNWSNPVGKPLLEAEIGAFVALDKAIEDYWFMRNEMKVLAAREARERGL